MASNPRNENSSMSNKLPAVCNFESDKLVMKLKVTLAAERKSVDPVVRSVMDIVRNMQCATGKEDDIEVALTEALANAVKHFGRAIGLFRTLASAWLPATKSAEC